MIGEARVLVRRKTRIMPMWSQFLGAGDMQGSGTCTPSGAAQRRSEDNEVPFRIGTCPRKPGTTRLGQSGDGILTRYSLDTHSITHSMTPMTRRHSRRIARGEPPGGIALTAVRLGGNVMMTRRPGGWPAGGGDEKSILSPE